MKTKILFFALLLCACFTAFAQAPDSLISYRHHIGLNTRVVLDRLVEHDSRLPLQLLYKYQFSPRSALRLSVDGMYVKSDSSRSYIDRLDEVTEFTYGGSVGYERQSSFGKLLVLYYGADAFYSRQGKNVEILNNFLNTDQLHEEVYVDEKNTTKALGLRPFAGLRANLTKRFYLSTETALSIKREIKTRDYYATVTVFNNEGEGVTYNYSDHSTKKIKISHLPINSISLYWLF